MTSKPKKLSPSMLQAMHKFALPPEKRDRRHTVSSQTMTALKKAGFIWMAPRPNDPNQIKFWQLSLAGQQALLAAEVAAGKEVLAAAMVIVRSALCISPKELEVLALASLHPAGEHVALSPEEKEAQDKLVAKGFLTARRLPHNIQLCQITATGRAAFKKAKEEQKS